jgi:4,5-dihydroxyphthalate decarboxylase
VELSVYGQGKLRLSAMMGTYPKTAPLKDGTLASDALALDFASIETAQKGFKQAVNDLAFGVSEIAIVTFLQAYAAGRPLLLLPFVMNGNFHHKSVLCRADDDLQPGDLAGRKVAMRSYSQTTPTWVRGILSDEYGVDIEKVRWLSQESGHVAGYEEPEWVSRIDGGLSLEEMLLAGEVDAILASGLAGKPGIRTLLPDPEKARKDWYARHHVVPINHMVAIRRELAGERPDLVREIYRLLLEAKARASGGVSPDGIELQPAGFEAVTPAIEMVARFAHEQRLIPQAYKVEKLFGDVSQALA